VGSITAIIVDDVLVLVVVHVNIAIRRSPAGEPLLLGRQGGTMRSRKSVSAL
jgi:hypothetical protein